ncbi:MAG: ATP-grasp domain-containing protein [Candidatus Omnitrophota bacterium]
MHKENKTIAVACAFQKGAPKDALGADYCMRSVKEALLSKGFQAGEFYINKEDFDNISLFKNKLKDLECNCVFNLFEGFFDDSQKEIEFAKLLEEMEMPFTGNSSETLKICLNKAMSRQVFHKNNLSVPKGVFIHSECGLEEMPFEPPFFIKPCFEDASVGIEKDALVRDKGCLLEITRKKLEKFPRGLLIEEFIYGKEYNVGFLGNYPYELLGVSLIDYNKYPEILPFLTHSSKWDEDSSAYKELIPVYDAKIDEAINEEIIDIARQAGKLLGCRGYFRVDLREKDSKLYILDVNPNPDINRDSGLTRQAYLKDYSYSDFIENILTQAQKTKALIHG